MNNGQSQIKSQKNMNWTQEEKTGSDAMSLTLLVKFYVFDGQNNSQLRYRETIWTYSNFNAMLKLLISQLYRLYCSIGFYLDFT